MGQAERRRRGYFRNIKRASERNERCIKPLLVDEGMMELTTNRLQRRLGAQLKESSAGGK